MFTEDRNFFARKCYRCDDFNFNDAQEKIHNFLKHYQEGGSRPTEAKPLNKTIIEHDFVKYGINYDDHSADYDFTDGMGLVEDFVHVFDRKFNSSGGKKLIFKFSFIIVNYQPAVQGGLPIYDSRFWLTKTYEGFYFNDFIKTSLIYDVRKRIRINGMTGSSWRFNRFQSLSLSINTKKNQAILR